MKRTLLFLMQCLAACAGTLSIRILDENGLPVPARVYLKDSQGKPLFAPGSYVYDRQRHNTSEQFFVPPQGSFHVESPQGELRIEIERGKEYLPVRDAIPVPESGRVERTYRLKRWVSMNSLGWYSGDMHPHPPLKHVEDLMDAEDLNITVPMTRWRVGGNRPGRLSEDPDLKTFLARADGRGYVRAGKARWFSVINEELESTTSALLVSHMGRQGTALDFPFPSYAKEARSRGGLLDSEKPTAYETPLLAATGGVDVMGLANNHFWRSGCFSAPWGLWPANVLSTHPATCGGFARAGLELYYALLNLGIPLKPSAGSAHGVHPVPMGWSRIYAHAPKLSDPEAWFQAVRAGRTFVTTGPMLLLRVAGHEPGDEVRGKKFPADVTAELQIFSSMPPQSAEIVVNGRPREIQLKPDGGNSTRFSGRIGLKLTGSSWIAARWIHEHDGTVDLAHTAPVYFWNGSEPIPYRRGEVEYFLGRIEKMKADVGADSPHRELQLQALRDAENFYRTKLSSVPR